MGFSGVGIFALLNRQGCRDATKDSHAYTTPSDSRDSVRQSPGKCRDVRNDV